MCSPKRAMKCTRAPSRPWNGATDAPQTVLKRYWLDFDEDERRWRGLQNQIFANQTVGLPQMIFAPGFERQILRGGCLFVREEFLALRECMQALGDQRFVVIEHTLGGERPDPYSVLNSPQIFRGKNCLVAILRQVFCWRCPTRSTSCLATVVRGEVRGE